MTAASLWATWKEVKIAQRRNKSILKEIKNNVINVQNLYLRKMIKDCVKGISKSDELLHRTFVDIPTRCSQNEDISIHRMRDLIFPWTVNIL